MTERTDFIGSVPYKGCLEVIKTDANQFIGFVRIKHTQEVANKSSSSFFSNADFMYFKDYTLDESGKPTFIDLVVEEGNPVYNFHIAFMRLPPQFDYVLTDKEGRKQGSIPIDKMHFGLTLFNLHKEGDTSSLASQFFIPPNHHYITSKDNEVSFAIGGPHGCESFIGFGSCRTPLFERKDFEKYFLMLLGTDNTIGFCSMNPAVMEDKLKQVITAKRTEGKVVGISNKSPKVYEVEGFTDNYGIHLILEDERGWEQGIFPVRSYLMEEENEEEEVKEHKLEPVEIE